MKLEIIHIQIEREEWRETYPLARTSTPKMYSSWTILMSNNLQKKITAIQLAT